VARPARIRAETNHGNRSRRFQDPVGSVSRLAFHDFNSSGGAAARAGSSSGIPATLTYNFPVTASARLSPIPAEIVDAFRAVAPQVEDFAREHGLLIERYRRGKSAWELHFARRVGGEAVLTISYRERTGHVLDVSVTWWVDDPDQRTRRLCSEKVAVFDRRDSPSVLRQQLEAGLRLIDGWTTADLGPPHGPFRALEAAAPPPLPLR
jgi:hypothetical protein